MHGSDLPEKSVMEAKSGIEGLEATEGVFLKVRIQTDTHFPNEGQRRVHYVIQ